MQIRHLLFVVTVLLVGGVLAGLPASSADDAPSACVYVGASVDGVTSTTEAVAVGDGTCPPLPPHPSDPCPEGVGTELTRDAGGAHVQAMACIEGVL